MLGRQDGATYGEIRAMSRRASTAMRGGWRERGGMQEGWSGRRGCARRLFKQEELGPRCDDLPCLSLVRRNLDYNQISNVSAGAFEGLGNLQEL